MVNCSASHRKGMPCPPATSVLIDLPLLRGDGGIKLDFPKGAFILLDILLQNRQQCLGLLWAEVDPLKVLYFHILRIQRLQASEHKQKVPNAHANLDGVGIAITVVRRIDQADIGLLWDGHCRGFSPLSKLSP